MPIVSASRPRATKKEKAQQKSGIFCYINARADAEKSVGRLILDQQSFRREVSADFNLLSEGERNYWKFRANEDNVLEAESLENKYARAVEGKLWNASNAKHPVDPGAAESVLRQELQREPGGMTSFCEVLREAFNADLFVAEQGAGSAWLRCHSQHAAAMCCFFMLDVIVLRRSDFEE